MQPFTIYLFIYVRRSKCFGRVFCPSSGAQNCTYRVRYLSDQYCYLLLAGQATLLALLSANLYDIHHCCVYSEKLLMMDRGTVRNM